MCGDTRFPIQVVRSDIKPLDFYPVQKHVPIGKVVGAMQDFSLPKPDGSLQPGLVRWFMRSKDTFSPTDACWDRLEEELRDFASVAAVQILCDAKGRDALLQSGREMNALRRRKGLQIDKLRVIHLRNARLVLSRNWVSEADAALTQDGERAVSDQDGNFLSHAIRLHIPQDPIDESDVENVVAYFFRKLQGHNASRFRAIT